MKVHFLISGLLVSSLASACAPHVASQPVGAAGGAMPTVSQPESDLDIAVAAARADAERQFGFSADALTLISAERVTWRDSSLGCPVRGMAYMQALVPGFRIRLRGPSGELDYHASARGGTPQLCPSKRAVDPLPKGGAYNSAV